MKKIFLIFVCFLILVSCMVLPCLAHMPNSFGDHPNYLNSNYGTISRFYTSPTEYTEEYFFRTYLKPDTNYTFYSTSGTRRLYIGEQIVYNNFNSAFSFTSPNYYSSTSVVQGSGDEYRYFSNTITEAGEYKLIFDFVNLSGYFDVRLFIGSGSSNKSLLYVGGNYDSGHFERSFTVSQADLDTYGSNFILLVRCHGVSTADFIIVSDSNYSGSYLPFYSEPIYNDEVTYVYNFRTPSTITTDTPILVGINDATQFDGYNELFSRYQALENSILSNDFYLIEGSFTPDELANIDLESSYNSGYNSGYDDGYKVGEADGLSSTSFMRSTIFTILSAPFVIVSNALDFDLLGINIYNLVKISITVLLIAWVITRLKGRE